MLLVFLLLLIDFSAIESTHFNGGTITWFPVNPSTNSSPVLITITQSYSWIYPDVKCDINVPMSTGNSFYYTVNLTCVASCSSDGGYSAKPISILTDCTSSSSSIGIMTSQRSVNISLTAGAHFTIAYQSLAWRKLGNTNTAYPAWSIACLIDLRKRPDGIINTPPVSSVASPQYVIANRTTQIKIPVSDVNVEDDLRCRWAQSTSSVTSADECADACYPTGLPAGTTLSNCTLTFTGLTGGIWYAISLQVEDFINKTSTTPMSSVPVEFLIYVMTNLSCSQVPIILPLTNCLEVQVGIPVNLTLYVMNQCNRTKTIITDIMDTISISGMKIGNLTNSTTNVSLSYVTLYWIPQINQIGSQQLCTIAYTNENVQSEEYCVTFLVKNLSYFCQTTTTSTTTITTSTVTTTTTTQTTTSTTQSTTTTYTTSTTTSTTRTTSTATTITTTSVTTTSTTTTQTTTTTTTTTSITTKTTISTTTSTTTTQTTTTTTTTITTTTTTSTTTSTTSTTQTTTTSVTTTSTTTSTTSVTTTTTTVTTTTSSATTSTTTSTITTVTTTTSVTSITTTSITTTTQTTQKTKTTVPVSNKMNIPLIVGLSLLALLIAICCCFWWLYFLLCKSSPRQRFSNKLCGKSQNENYWASEDNTNTSLSHHLTASTLLSTNDDQSIIKENKSSIIGKYLRSKPYPMNKVSDSKENQQDKQKIVCIPLNNLTAIKLSRKETTKSHPHHRSNEDETNCTNDHTKSDQDTSTYINNQSIINTENNNTMRRRTSSVSVVPIIDINKMTNDTKIKNNPTENDLSLNHNRNKHSKTRVTRISSKQKRSTIQPYNPSNN